MRGDTLVQITLDKFATHSKFALQNQLEVQISPNPVNDLLHIQSEKGMDALVISDLNGKEVCQMQLSSVREVHLPTGHLKKGVYFARILGAGSTEVQTVKFVKME